LKVSVSLMATFWVYLHRYLWFQSKVCDFVFNCNDGHDESGCPTFFTFDECSADLKNCHWKEDFPDKVDWIAVSGIDTYFN
jgi:hypothetical protein